MIQSFSKNKISRLRQGFTIILAGLFLFSTTSPSILEARRYSQTKNVSANNLRTQLQLMEEAPPSERFKRKMNTLLGIKNKSDLISSFIASIFKKYQLSHNFLISLMDQIVGWKTNDWQNALGSKAIGKQARVSQIIQKNGELFLRVVAAEYPSDVLRYVKLRETALDVGSMLQYFIDWSEAESPKHKLLKAMLSYYESLPIPIKTYTFSTLVRDLEGYASAPDHMIALHADLASHPLALLHEMGEYMAQTGALEIQLKEHRLLVTINGIKLAIPEYYELHADALAIAKKDPSNPHYLLRALARELSASFDFQLTQQIKAIHSPPDPSSPESFFERLDRPFIFKRQSHPLELTGFELGQSFDGSGWRNIIPEEILSFNDPQLGSVFKSEVNTLAMAFLKPGQKAAIYSRDHNTCLSCDIRANKGGQIVIGHAHIRPQITLPVDKSQASGGLFERYRKVLDYLTDKANGLTDIQMVLSVDSSLLGLPSIKKLEEEARSRGIEVFSSMKPKFHSADSLNTASESMLRLTPAQRIPEYSYQTQEWLQGEQIVNEEISQLEKLKRSIKQLEGSNIIHPVAISQIMREAALFIAQENKAVRDFRHTNRIIEKNLKEIFSPYLNELFLKDELGWFLHLKINEKIYYINISQDGNITFLDAEDFWSQQIEVPDSTLLNVFNENSTLNNTELLWDWQHYEAMRRQKQVQELFRRQDELMNEVLDMFKQNPEEFKRKEEYYYQELEKLKQELGEDGERTAMALLHNRNVEKYENIFLSARNIAFEKLSSIKDADKANKIKNRWTGFAVEIGDSNETVFAIYGHTIKIHRNLWEEILEQEDQAPLFIAEITTRAILKKIEEEESELNFQLAELFTNNKLYDLEQKIFTSSKREFDLSRIFSDLSLEGKQLLQFAAHQDPSALFAPVDAINSNDLNLFFDRINDIIEVNGEFEPLGIEKFLKQLRTEIDLRVGNPDTNHRFHLALDKIEQKLVFLKTYAHTNIYSYDFSFVPNHQILWLSKLSIELRDIILRNVSRARELIVKDVFTKVRGLNGFDSIDDFKALAFTPKYRRLNLENIVEAYKQLNSREFVNRYWYAGDFFKIAQQNNIELNYEVDYHDKIDMETQARIRAEAMQYLMQAISKLPKPLIWKLPKSIEIKIHFEPIPEEFKERLIPQLGFAHYQHGTWNDHINITMLGYPTGKQLEVMTIALIHEILHKLEHSKSRYGSDIYPLEDFIELSLNNGFVTYVEKNEYFGKLWAEIRDISDLKSLGHRNELGYLNHVYKTRDGLLISWVGSDLIEKFPEVISKLKSLGIEIREDDAAHHAFSSPGELIAIAGSESPDSFAARVNTQFLLTPREDIMENLQRHLLRSSFPVAERKDGKKIYEVYFPMGEEGLTTRFQDEDGIWYDSLSEALSKGTETLVIKYGEQIPVQHLNQFYDSYAIYKAGEVLEEAAIKTMEAQELVDLIHEVSRQIRSQPAIQAFVANKLDTDKTENAQVLAWQYLFIWDRLGQLIDSMGPEQILSLLNYVFDPSPGSKPFNNIITTALRSAYLFNRENLLQVWPEKEMPLREAVPFMDAQSIVPPVLLAGPVTISSLKKYFTQPFEQNERNIVLTNRGLAFLLKGLDPKQGHVTYRTFNDLILDIHTHPFDWAFSTGDINTYKVLEIARDIYSIQEDVSFFVQTPSGLFAFLPVDFTWNPDLRDRKGDVYRMPVTVKYVTLKEQTIAQSFAEYTNHDKGECGQFMIQALQSGVRELSVTFQNEDRIQYYPWNVFEEEGFLETSISELPQVFSTIHKRFNTQQTPSITATVFEGELAWLKNLPARLVFALPIPIQEGLHIILAKSFGMSVKWKVGSLWSAVSIDYSLAPPWQGIVVRLGGLFGNLMVGLLTWTIFGAPTLDLNNLLTIHNLISFFILTNLALFVSDTVLSLILKRGDLWDAAIIWKSAYATFSIWNYILSYMAVVLGYGMNNISLLKDRVPKWITFGFVPQKEETLEKNVDSIVEQLLSRFSYISYLIQKFSLSQNPKLKQTPIHLIDLQASIFNVDDGGFEISPEAQMWGEGLGTSLKMQSSGEDRPAAMAGIIIKSEQKEKILQVLKDKWGLEDKFVLLVAESPKEAILESQLKNAKIVSLFTERPEAWNTELIKWIITLGTGRELRIIGEEFKMLKKSLQGRLGQEKNILSIKGNELVIPKETLGLDQTEMDQKKKLHFEFSA